MVKNTIWPVLALSVILLTACKQELDPEAPDAPVVPDTVEVTDGIYITGTANIFVDEDMVAVLESGTPATRSAAFNDALGEIGFTSMERIFPDAGEFEPRSREMGLHRWYRIHYSPSVKSDKVAEALSSVPGIITLEPIIRTKQMGIPFNDPQIGSQWQYWNDGSRSEWIAGCDMQVIPVWRYYTTGSSKVVIAVVDSGIDLNHEDLLANVDADNSHNFVNNSSVIEPGSHGTHVAGSIAAVNNNGIGVAGMAGGDAANGIPGCRLISCQVFSDKSSGGFESAIKWAADHGAVLCNNSWGYDFSNDDGTYRTEDARETHEFYLQPNTGEYASALKSAVDYFNRYAGLDAKGNQVGPMAGGVCMFSAGNDNKPYGAPACYPEVVAVGGVGPQGGRAYYSNYGDWVDVSATGGDYHYSQILSTLPNNEYGSFQGTSMSCPHAVGVAALVVSAFGGEGFTRENLLERLLNTKNPTVSVQSQEIGVLMDALAAMTYGEEMVPGKVTDARTDVASNSVTLSWSLTGSGRLPASGYHIFAGTDRNAVAASTVDKTAGGARKYTFISTAYEPGETVSYSFKSLDFETTYWYKIIGFDKNPVYSEESDLVSAYTPANNPPVVTPSESIAGFSVRSFETKTISFSVEDPDGHEFTVSITPGSDAERWNETSAGHTVTIDGSKVQEGSYTAVITATDRYKATTEYPFKYTVLPNNPPVAVKSIDNLILIGKESTAEYNISEYFSDPDGEYLTYETENTATSVLHAAVNAGVLHITPIGYGLSTITVYAKDARGEKASFTFQVLVREPGVEYQLYPNPVVKDLFVSTGTELEQTQVTIASGTGNIVYDETISASAFAPGVVSMEKFAPGKYVVTIRFSGKEYQQTVIKK